MKNKISIGISSDILEFPMLERVKKLHNYITNYAIFNIIDESENDLCTCLLDNKIEVLINYITNDKISKTNDIPLYFKYHKHINFKDNKIVVKKLNDLKMCFACSKEYYDEIKDKVHTYDDLIKNNITLMTDDRRYEFIKSFLTSHNINLNVETQGIYGSCFGRYYSIFPNFFGYVSEDEAKACNLVKIEFNDEIPNIPYGIAYFKDKEDSLKDIIDILIN